ncbi:MAG: hypothetical protein KC776_33605 [Myxococcales bacterium]|nr:hypothetical protein [Myxococcales bacterium]MCB9576570.1 hypothetical protein [Polyangiaceae bacterium]
MNTRLSLRRSTRELQAYGAACIATYSSALGLRSNAIRELVEHLLLLLTAEDLPDWEGGTHDLALLDDELPEAFLAELPESAAQTCDRLVDLVSEIGLIDMYGANTEAPLRHAEQAVALLQQAGVPPPPVVDVLGEEQADAPVEPRWGEPVPPEVYLRARDWCIKRLDSSTRMA